MNHTYINVINVTIMSSPSFRPKDKAYFRCIFAKFLTIEGKTM